MTRPGMEVRREAGDGDGDGAGRRRVPALGCQPPGLARTPFSAAAVPAGGVRLRALVRGGLGSTRERRPSGRAEAQQSGTHWRPPPAQPRAARARTVRDRGSPRGAASSRSPRPAARRTAPFPRKPLRPHSAPELPAARASAWLLPHGAPPGMGMRGGAPARSPMSMAAPRQQAPSPHDNDQSPTLGAQRPPSATRTLYPPLVLSR